jgi:hypothetical protein
MDILDDAGNPLIDNGLVEISSHSDVRHIPILYTMIKSVNEGGNNSPLRERLLWEQATMARIIVDAGGPDQMGGLSGELFRNDGDEGLPFPTRNGWIISTGRPPWMMWKNFMKS